MAKKAKQLLIEGTGDVIPDVVRDAADEYVAAKRKLGNCRETMNTALADLIGKMQENDVSEILIDEQNKKLTLSFKALVKISKRKKPEQNEDGEGE